MPDPSQDNWRWVKLQEVCETTSGGTPSRSVAAYYAGGIPWVKSGELNDAPIFQTEESITEAAVANSSAKVFPSGTLLIALYGATVGRLGVLKTDAATNQAVCAIFPNEAVDSGFLFFYLLKQRDNLIESRAGGAQPNISQEIVRNLQIPIPPLPEQKRIAAILARADRLRRLRRTARELSDTYLQSVFLEMFGDGSRFEATKLQDLLIDSPKNGLYLPAEKYGSGTPIIRINNFYDGVLGNPEQFRRVRATQQHIEEFGVTNGEILINRVNSLEFLGKCALVQGLSEPTLFESNMMRVRVNTEIVLPIYLVTFLTSRQAYAQIMQRARKAVNQASINQQDVKSLVVPVPPLPLQQEFAHIVHEFERLRVQQREAERQSEHLFQTLLHRAFRGEL